MGNPDLYGWPHQRVRKVWRIRIDEGGVNCCRCGKPIPAGAPFHLDHDDDDKTKYLGAAHPHCNISATQGGWRARKAAGQRQEPSRDVWYAGYDGVPEGTISRFGNQISTGNGHWLPLWLHELMTKGKEDDA